MSLVDIAIGAVGSAIGDIAGPYVNIFSAQRQIGGIIPDVVVREVLSDTYTITNHPVEGGTPISDHYFRNPRVVELTLGFSDCTNGDGFSVQSFQAFRALAATRETFTIDTGKCSYDSMLLGEVSAVTDPESETILMLTVRAQEVIVTQTSGGGASSNSTDPQTTTAATDVGQQTPTALGQGGIGSDAKFTATPATGTVTLGQGGIGHA